MSRWSAGALPPYHEAHQRGSLVVRDDLRGKPQRQAERVDEAHMFEPHYDRHVWIYRENPKGVFAPFSPNVTCTHHRGGSHQHASR